MNKIDRRTGKPFPSVQRQDHIESVSEIAQDSYTIRRGLNELIARQNAELTDPSNDWRLELDPQSLRGWGVFSDTHVIYREFEKDEMYESVERPVEWFQRVGELTKKLLNNSDELWDVINPIFDQAIATADAELGFKEDTE